MSQEKRKLFVLLGPTASGKTAISLQLSEFFELEIISADSRQIYKFLDIGTAKPTPEELKKVKHHFISIINPDEYYSAGIFAREASAMINSIYNNKKIPLVVGGSGLYIKALCEGLFEEHYDESIKKKHKNELLKLKNKFGVDYLYEQLNSIDPEAAAMYPDKNPSRILRALEHYYVSGTKFSSSIKNMSTPNFEPFYIGLLTARQTLYSRINQRTNIMWKNGLLEETKSILDKGYPPDLNSLNTVGYKECIALLRNEISEKVAIEKIKQHTRNYAKRQMTWFRKIPDVHWIKNDNNTLINIFELMKKTLSL